MAEVYEVAKEVKDLMEHEHKAIVINDPRRKIINATMRRAYDLMLLQLGREVIDKERWRNIWEKAYADATDDAVGGIVRDKARTFLALYFIGKPTTPVKITVERSSDLSPYEELSDEELIIIASQLHDRAIEGEAKIIGSSDGTINNSRKNLETSG